MSDAYFILEDGQQSGPYTFAELTEMELEIHTRVLSPLAEGWEDACDLPEFFRYFEERGIYFPTEDNLASFGWRFLAFFVDYIILSLLMDAVLIALAANGWDFSVKSYNDLLKMQPEKILLLQLITSVTFIVYNTICEASAMKGSLGKRLCRVVVVDADGTGPTVATALVRSICKAVSMAFFFLGFISFFFTDHKQTLHDYMARTYVVKRD